MPLTKTACYNQPIRYNRSRFVTKSELNQKTQIIKKRKKDSSKRNHHQSFSHLKPILSLTNTCYKINSNLYRNNAFTLEVIEQIEPEDYPHGSEYYLLRLSAIIMVFLWLLGTIHKFPIMHCWNYNNLLSVCWLRASIGHTGCCQVTLPSMLQQCNQKGWHV